jgi:hypothetical protein
VKQKQIKIICGSLFFGLFLLFGFSNHALATPIDVAADCNNPIINHYDGSDEYNFYCNMTLYKCYDPEQGNGLCSDYADIYSCGAPGEDACTTNTLDSYSPGNSSIGYNFGIGLAGPAFAVNDVVNNVFYNPDGTVRLFSDIVASASGSWPDEATTSSSTPALGVLDTIGTSMFSTIIYFLEIFFTQFWPIVLVIAIVTAFVSSLTYYVLKIINQR